MVPLKIVKLFHEAGVGAEMKSWFRGRASHLLVTVKQCWFWQSARVSKMIYFNLGTANGHLKTGQGREVAWLPIGGRTAAVGERAVGSRPPGDGVEKSCCSAAFRLRLLFCGCGVFGFGDVLRLVPWSDK